MRKEYGKREFKWYRAGPGHGVALVDYFFHRRDRMRVDVLIWDMEDSRHKQVRHRDDKADFARMYYHLLHSVLKLRWPDGARWLICPDQNDVVDWLTLEQCLGWKSWAIEAGLSHSTDQTGALRDFYNIQELRPVCSREYLLVQLADLFAGLGVYSYSAFDKYVQWKREREPTQSLFPQWDSGLRRPRIKKTDRKRLPILHHVREEAGRWGLHVSLESKGGLYTWRPSEPLNFWLYTPQCASDKAPAKQGSIRNG